MGDDPKDHDLLIRIDTNLVVFNKIFQEHVTQDITQFSVTNQKIDAVHRRVDGFVKVGNMLLGIFIFITGIGSVTGVLVTFKNLGWFK